MTYNELAKQVKSGKLAPVYFLYGEEDYFTDQLSALIETEALAGGEPEFNLNVFYGAEADGASILDAARSYPVMATRRLVVLREAQRLRKPDQERLAAYLERPSPTTVLLLIHKDKKRPDMRSRYGKAIAAHTTVYEAKALYDNQVPRWVEDHLQEAGVQITPDAAQILAARVGTNLTQVSHELDKLKLHFAAHPALGKKVDRELVFEFVDIDKDYNVFALLDQVGARNAPQVHIILDQMVRNPKANPAIPMVSQLYGFFSRLALLKQQRITGEKGIADALGINPFFAKNYISALQRYSTRELIDALETIAEADLALKGILPSRMGEAHILKTLMMQLLMPEALVRA